MSRGKKRVLQIGIALALVADGFALASAILVHNIWLVAICLGGLAIGLYWLFVRFHQEKEPRYPLVPPEGKGDIYLPRTDIPDQYMRTFVECRIRNGSLKR